MIERFRLPTEYKGKRVFRNLFMINWFVLNIQINIFIFKSNYFLYKIKSLNLLFKIKNGIFFFFILRKWVYNKKL